MLELFVLLLIRFAWFAQYRRASADGRIDYIARSAAPIAVSPQFLNNCIARCIVIPRRPISPTLSLAPPPHPTPHCADRVLSPRLCRDLSRPIPPGQPSGSGGLWRSVIRRLIHNRIRKRRGVLSPIAAMLSCSPLSFARRIKRRRNHYSSHRNRYAWRPALICAAYLAVFEEYKEMRAALLGQALISR